MVHAQSGDIRVADAPGALCLSWKRTSFKQKSVVSAVCETLSFKRRICVDTDARATSYLFQRISVTLQRFNSVLLHDTLPVDLPDL